MTEDRFCGTCARYQNVVACKFVEPVKDPKEGVFGCKNWTDNPEDIESNPVARGPIITDCLPGSPSVCVNCARYNPTDGYCKLRSVRVYPAESTTCMNWLHKQYRPKQPAKPEASVSFQYTTPLPYIIDKDDRNGGGPVTDIVGENKQQESQPVFGGTSLNELEAKAKVWGHQQEAKALDRGAKQGMTQEALDTVFAIACQQLPSMEKRWMELKAEINLMFAQKWTAEDMPE